MPKLIKLYIIQCLIGFGIAGIFTAMLLWFNLGNLWGLVTKDPLGWLAVAMIWFFNGTVFASVQFAIVVMGMRDDGPQKPSTGSRITEFMRPKERAYVPASETPRRRQSGL